MKLTREETLTVKPILKPIYNTKSTISNPIYHMSTTAARTNKDIFTLFDKKGQGTIPKPLFGDYLRAIGYNPTNQQTEQILANGSAPEQLSLNSIHELIQRNQQELEATTSGRVEDFIKAFQVFDKENTGKVSVGDVRYMLTSLGERLSDEEVNELLKGVEIDSDGGIDYKKFIEDILRQ